MESVTVGISDYAQDALGDVVYVDLPDVGRIVEAGEVFAEVESTKSVNDVYAPVSGVITAVNEPLVDTPELVNSDPFGEGWFVTITPDGWLESRRSHGCRRLSGVHRGLDRASPLPFRSATRFVHREPTPAHAGSARFGVGSPQRSETLKDQSRVGVA